MCVDVIDTSLIKLAWITGTVVMNWKGSSYMISNKQIISMVFRKFAITATGHPFTSYELTAQ